MLICLRMKGQNYLYMQICDKRKIFPLGKPKIWKMLDKSLNLQLKIKNWKFKIFVWIFCNRVLERAKIIFEFNFSWRLSNLYFDLKTLIRTRSGKLFWNHNNSVLQIFEILVEQNSCSYFSREITHRLFEKYLNNDLVSSLTTNNNNSNKMSHMRTMTPHEMRGKKLGKLTQ